MPSKSTSGTTNYFEYFNIFVTKPMPSKTLPEPAITSSILVFLFLSKFLLFHPAFSLKPQNTIFEKTKRRALDLFLWAYHDQTIFDSGLPSRTSYKPPRLQKTAGRILNQYSGPASILLFRLSFSRNPKSLHFWENAYHDQTIFDNGLATRTSYKPPRLQKTLGKYFEPIFWTS